MDTPSVSGARKLPAAAPVAAAAEIPTASVVITAASVVNTAASATSAVTTAASAISAAVVATSATSKAVEATSATSAASAVCANKDAALAALIACMPALANCPVLTTAADVPEKAASPATSEDAPDIVPFSTVPRSVLSRALSTNSPVNYVAS